MPPLPKEQLNNINPNKIYKLPLAMDKELWRKFRLPVKLPKPVKLYFDENIRNNLQSKSIKYKREYICLLSILIFLFILKLNI